jgi:hypothetical protein
MQNVVWLLVLLLAAVLWIPPIMMNAQSEPVTLQGKVTAGDGGQALAGARVELRPAVFDIIPTTKADFDKLKSRFDVRISSTTDERGEFILSSVSPGRYFLSVTLQGYMLPGSREVVVAAGKAPPDLTVRLIRAAVIEGAVENSERQPVAGASVQLVESRVQGGTWALIPVATVSAGENGRFEFAAVAPGAYYLLSAGQRSLAGRTAQPAERYADTFYPRSGELEGAAPIRVASGIDQRGLRLTLLPAALRRVSGRVEGLPPDVKATVTLERVAETDYSLKFPRTAALPLTAPVGLDGAFLLEGVGEGTYLARLMAGPSSLRGSAVAHVRGKDLDNLLIPIPPAFDLKGRLVADGIQLPERVQMLLWELEGDFGARRLSPVDVTESHRFEVKNAAFGPHRLSFARKGELAIAEVSAGGRTFEGSRFDLASAGEIVVKLAKEGAVITGRISGASDRRNDPAASAGFVTVIATPVTGLESETLQAAEIGSDGSFTVRGLDPGNYRICAWQGDRGRAMALQTLLAWQKRLDSACKSHHAVLGRVEAITVDRLTVAEFE